MDQSIKKKYNYWQWKTLIVLMIGYALFYFVRKNFSIVMPALESELGLSKAKLGLFLTLNGVIYGVSRFVNGFFADRMSRKKMMAAGLFLSAVVNILIGLSPQMDGLFNLLDAEGKATTGLVVLIGSLWLINGYTQGMGYPPCGSLMAHWIKPSELATKQSIWNSSHSIGAGLVSVLCGTLILQKFSYSAWQWCFFIPAILAIAGSVMLLLTLKDTPASVGLPDPESMDENAPSKADVQVEDPSFTEKVYRRLVSKMVFRNPVIWILAITNFCVYVIRFTILDWGSTFLTQDRGLTIQAASTVVAASELAGGIVGTLIAGWATDRFFKSRSQRTCLIGLLGATLCFLLFWLTPKGMNGLAVTCIIMASFFVYMPQALIGIACSNQATKRVAASANGLAGIFGYASTTVSGLMFGYLAEHFGWNSVFEVAIVFGVIGVILFAFIWNAPSDGYSKAEPIIEEVRGEMAAK
ncbi:MAG: MFS transporter [Bacteroidales bacterium]|uniref:MFS transporter n=1 Tax=Candidatus Cryptobacteroides sp. TaxID=2952915 RepID=UPI002A80A9CE|nr:MFS transporter [Candidatus Cryptobacteroides sp.]MDD7136502.1 MFS transporter [Bacteroidales bacterium]MDD7623735.1 MFS transporter [Bacteroidales bacterium]MDY3878058.1 MFS transporter [Candidatus Cryptobacteroides sp.]MDY5565926.1 MFS transporter [Candidatus Cryptobacteroides sp.]